MPNRVKIFYRMGRFFEKKWCFILLILLKKQYINERIV